METNNIKYVAQGLLQSWKEEKKKDVQYSHKVVPLMYYLEWNYKERYVALCLRLNVTPISLGKWLRKEIKDIV
jgi:hypothetical protein